MTGRYLLDTHVLYWWMRNDPRLGAQARSLIETGDVLVSVATLWEMRIKHGKGKLPLPSGDLAGHIESQGFRILPIFATHTEATAQVPARHGDPFDRLLIAVAAVESLRLLTADATILALELPFVLPA